MGILTNKNETKAIYFPLMVDYFIQVLINTFNRLPFSYDMV